GVAATTMTMPETAMDLNNGHVPLEHQVGTTRKFLGVQAVTQTGAMEISADEKFGFGILTADPGHHATSGFPVDYIHAIAGLEKASCCYPANARLSCSRRSLRLRIDGRIA